MRLTDHGIVQQATTITTVARTTTTAPIDEAVLMPPPWTLLGLVQVLGLAQSRPMMARVQVPAQVQVRGQAQDPGQGVHGVIGVHHQAVLLLVLGVVPPPLVLLDCKTSCERCMKHSQSCAGVDRESTDFCLNMADVFCMELI